MNENAYREPESQERHHKKWIARMNICISFWYRKMFEVGPNKLFEGFEDFGMDRCDHFGGEDFEDVDPDLASQSS